jgi:hypothetical protein
MFHSCGSRREAEFSDALDPIQPLIAERHRIGGYPFGRARAAPRSLLPAHFEDIGEIGGKMHPERHHVAVQIEIADQQQLVIRGLPDELAAVHINQLAMQHAAVRRNRVGIGKING